MTYKYVGCTLHTSCPRSSTHSSASLQWNVVNGNDQLIVTFPSTPFRLSNHFILYLVLPCKPSSSASSHPIRRLKLLNLVQVYNFLHNNIETLPLIRIRYPPHSTRWTIWVATLTCWINIFINVFAHHQNHSTWKRCHLRHLLPFTTYRVILSILTRV